MSDEAPDGYRYEWLPDETWKVGGDGRECRQLRCSNPAVAALGRRHRNPSGFTDLRWWYYCAAHLYGRKIDDGVVKSQRLVKIEEEIKA